MRRHHEQHPTWSPLATLAACCLLAALAASGGEPTVTAGAAAAPETQAPANDAEAADADRLQLHGFKTQYLPTP